MEDKETCNKGTQDPQGKPRLKTRLEVTAAPLEQRRFPRQAVNRQTNSSKSLSRSHPDTDQLIRSTKYTGRSKTKEQTRIPPMGIPTETPENSKGDKRKSPGTPGTGFSPQTDNTKQSRFESPPKNMDNQPPAVQPAPRGKTGYIKAVRTTYNWKDINLDACMLRKHVSEQLSTFNRKPKVFSRNEIENKAKVEICKMEWMITKELHKTLIA